MSINNPGAALVASLIPHGSIGVEIGVWKGESSLDFLTRASFMHLVDPWPDRDEQYREVVELMKGRPVNIHRCTSARFFGTFKERVDWVYIDGLHDYESVKADLIGARSILKPSGVIYGDDYGKKGGVKEAVDEFAPHRTLLGLHQYAIT